jgi:hypothetical protein
LSHQCQANPNITFLLLPFGKKTCILQATICMDYTMILVSLPPAFEQVQPLSSSSVIVIFKNIHFAIVLVVEVTFITFVMPRIRER